MSIERAEQLKREWTDKYVVVQADIPQLRRFRNLTGVVKTVNMNCRALVQFDGPEDISWYDIDLDHLQVVDAPRKKEPAHAKQAPSEVKPEAPKAPAAKSAGKSPLQLAREQAAGGGKPAEAKPAEAKPAGKKLSPLELARQQGATKAASEAAPKAEETPAAAPASPPPVDTGRKLSPLERARMQDANKKKS